MCFSDYVVFNKTNFKDYSYINLCKCDSQAGELQIIQVIRVA
jgi:hypothetical protein